MAPASDDSALIDALAQSAFVTMGALTRIAADNELSLTQLRALAILRDRRLRMSDLVDYLGLEKSTLTGLIARAEARGLVSRTPNADDKRAVDVTLSPDGLALAERLERDLAQHLMPTVSALPRAERATLGILLAKAVATPTGERARDDDDDDENAEPPERWTQSTVYPDMWIDPDDDPRDAGASPEGELATLQDFLTGYRHTLRMKCDGLSPEQVARRSVPPSTMSLLGLLRHLAEVERDWQNWITTGDPLPRLYGPKDSDFDGAVADQAVVDAAYTDLAREQAATDAILAAHPDLGEQLGREQIAVRELMVHRIEEYARHCGHADLLRERIDGRVGQ